MWYQVSSLPAEGRYKVSSLPAEGRYKVSSTKYQEKSNLRCIGLI